MCCLQCVLYFKRTCVHMKQIYKHVLKDTKGFKRKTDKQMPCNGKDSLVLYDSEVSKLRRAVAANDSTKVKAIEDTVKARKPK